MMKIAFCFLIYDIINHEKLWYKFFENVDKNKYNIYIHYKSNVLLKYFEKYKLDNCIETKYGDISLVYAYNLLFKKALDDKENYKFCILSGACIPLKSFDYVYKFLIQDNYGHFNVVPNQKGCFPRCNPILNYYDKSIIRKSSGWFILNRKIADICVNSEEINKKVFEEIRFAEEHFYITLIYKNNLQDEIIETQNIPLATTFTNWGDMKFKYHSYSKNSGNYKNGLANYKEIYEEELEYLLKEKNVLFGRKFLPECIVIPSNINLQEKLLFNSKK